MTSKLFKIRRKHLLPLVDLDKRASNAIQKHFGLTNYQMLLLIWIKGLWSGILISLIIHYYMNQ